jgi:hypothetical protein
LRCGCGQVSDRLPRLNDEILRLRAQNDKGERCGDPTTARSRSTQNDREVGVLYLTTPGGHRMCLRSEKLAWELAQEVLGVPHDGVHDVRRWLHGRDQPGGDSGAHPGNSGVTAFSGAEKLLQ